MIVECINDNWIGPNGPEKGNDPKKGEIYEVVNTIKERSLTVYVLFGFPGVGYLCNNFREVDIDIKEIEEIIKETVEI